MEKEKIEIWKTALMGEALLLGLLGKALYQDPNRDWLESLIAEDVFGDVPFGEEQLETKRGLKLLQAWSQKYAGGIPDKEFEAVKKDHLYLFTGVGNVLAPVWESVYFNEGRLIFQEQTLQVREWFARFGLQAERKGKEPDDHIGLELSFTAHLASLALQSLEAGNDQEFEGFLKAQRDFLKEHLLRWGIAWARLVKQHGETEFYLGLAHLTQGALLAVADLLDIKMPKDAES